MKSDCENCKGVHGREVSHKDYLIRKNKSRQERPLLKDKERRNRIRNGNPVCIRGHRAIYDFRRLGIYCSTCRASRYGREKTKDGLRYRTSKYRERANKRIREQYKKNPTIRIEQSDEWRKKNPEKHKAHTALHYAIRKGKIIKPDCCEFCGVATNKLYAHHFNYSKPLAVKWLCPVCHPNVHLILENKAGIRQPKLERWVNENFAKLKT